MAMQKIAIGSMLAVAIVGMVISVLGALVATTLISNTGNVKAIGVGVYWDNAGSNPVTSIDWGVLDPGTTVSRTIYVCNEGNTQIILSMTTTNWHPASASSYITLTWNREGYVLSAGSVVEAVLTLSVSSEISSVTSFSFDIVITGTA